MVIPRSAFAVIGGALVAGCIEGKGPELEATAAVSFYLGRSALDGMSMKFASASRAEPADAKYRCNNSLSTDTCFPLSTTTPLTFDDLCPSTDIPTAYWNFTYELYSSSDCSGNPIPTSAMKCFDSHDLFAQSHPNQTLGESLQPGANNNAIECIPQGKFCTYTQGAYTATCKGNNPPAACLLENHFGGSFPSGLFIGDGVTWTGATPNNGTNGNLDGGPPWAAVWTSSSSVKVVLGDTGTPNVLTGDLTDSSTTPAGTFATQLITTTLNVKFNLDGWLGTAATKLADLKAVGGCTINGKTMLPALGGMTVRQILQLAEDTISGASAVYTPAQLTEALDVINMNFDNCVSDGGCLTL